MEMKKVKADGATSKIPATEANEDQVPSLLPLKSVKGKVLHQGNSKRLLEPEDPPDAPGTRGSQASTA
jgi:hypothetical protein